MNTETAIAHLEVYTDGGDELGVISDADASDALAVLRTDLDKARAKRDAALKEKETLRELFDRSGEVVRKLNQDCCDLLAERDAAKRWAKLWKQAAKIHWGQIRLVGSLVEKLRC